MVIPSADVSVSTAAERALGQTETSTHRLRQSHKSGKLWGPRKPDMPPPNSAAQLVCETLDAIVSPEVRDALVARALEESEYDEIPRLGSAFVEFVDGPLRNAIEQGLGGPLAESLLQELRNSAAQREALSSHPTPRRASMPRRSVTPTPGSTGRRSTPAAPRAASVPLTRVALTPSSQRADTPPGGGWRSDQYPAGAARTLGLVSEPPVKPSEPELPSPANPAPPGWPPKPPSTTLASTRRPGVRPPSRPITAQEATAVPVVVVATSSGEVVLSFEKLMGDRAEVAPIQSVRDLVLLLEASPKSKVVLVVDCPNATIRPTAVAALSDELTHRVSVILWGADAATYQEVLRVSPRAERFLMCAVTASPDAVVARCRAIVG